MAGRSASRHVTDDSALDGRTRRPYQVVAVIEAVCEVTDKEIEKIVQTARISGVLYTRRTDDEGVAERNTLSATWHRHATFRALNSLCDSGIPVTVEYA